MFLPPVQQDSSLQRLGSGATTKTSGSSDSDAQRHSHQEEDEDEDEGEEKEDQQRSRRKSIGEEGKNESLSSSSEVKDVLDGRLSPQPTTTTTTTVATTETSPGQALFTLEDVENSPLLQISKLSEWDFPIFDLAEQEKTFVLSKVSGG